MSETKEKVIEYSPEEFLKEIDNLGLKMGYRLNVSPQLFQQDNGTFSIKIMVNPVKRSEK